MTNEERAKLVAERYTDKPQLLTLDIVAELDAAECRGWERGRDEADKKMRELLANGRPSLSMAIRALTYKEADE